MFDVMCAVSTVADANLSVKLCDLHWHSDEKQILGVGYLSERDLTSQATKYA